MLDFVVLSSHGLATLRLGSADKLTASLGGIVTDVLPNFRNQIIDGGRLVLLCLLTAAMFLFMGLPSHGMHDFLSGNGIVLAYDEFTMVWVTNSAFWVFTFLVTEMVNIERGWWDWPAWAKAHTLLVASCYFGALLETVKIGVQAFDTCCVGWM